jgi:sugar transferase (PEP-CTERM/EpsH1 system associated)
VRILYIFPFLPHPPTDGGKRVAWTLLQFLGSRHRVTLVTTYRQESELAALAFLERYCERLLVFQRPKRWSLRNIVRSVIGVPFPIASFSVPGLRKKLGKLLARDSFDTVQVDYYYMVPNLPPDCPVPILYYALIVESGVYAELAQRCRSPLRTMAYRWLAGAIAAYEKRACERADYCVAITPESRTELRRLGCDREIFVQRPGIDTEYYRPGSDEEQDPYSLVFVGAMRYPPNVDAMLSFCADVLPRVRRLSPQARLWIVGNEPTEEIRALARQPGIDVTGYVEDVRPYWRRASVAVLPLRVGGGIRLKLLEAMAMGKAVVTTEAGAEGTGGTPGRHYLVARGPEELADLVATLLGNPGKRRQLQAAARQLAASSFSWESFGAHFEQLHGALSASTRLRRPDPSR